MVFGGLVGRGREVVIMQSASIMFDLLMGRGFSCLGLVMISRLLFVDDILSYLSYFLSMEFAVF